MKVGIKRRKERGKRGEVMEVPTDKSGKFAIMPLSVYEEMGTVHTSKDTTISEDQLSKLQKELNDHVRMFTKVFNVGATHGEKNVDRIRSGFTTGANAAAVLWLMPKDHKEVKEGVPMASRPVVSVTTTILARFSRLVTIVVRSLADNVKRTTEVKSGENLKADVIKLNKDLKEEARQANADPISLLMQQALDGVVSVPWTLMLDKWRAKVFTGETSPEELNNSWWELREFYQGIGAPRDRDVDAFDPGAKYHIPGNTPYTRYYLAKILQYQFHESLCNQMGFEGPLHECSIYENELAGEKLRAMLALGQSQEWQTALEALTGTRELSGKSMLNYYQPLKDWLDIQNAERTCGWEG